MHTKSPHSFHIPVMGTSFTIDTPLKIARYGISSVISIGDDELCETMRGHYSKINAVPFTPILKTESNYRSRRITAYLDMVNDLVQKQTEELRNAPFEKGSEITKYFELLKEDTPLKCLFQKMQNSFQEEEKKRLQTLLRTYIKPGSIDVNIMTKLDRNNFQNGVLLPEEYSDALSALRGFANSTLRSSVVFSAGFNRRLYAYIENFPDFFPDQFGHTRKKIILKVSDFRSSLTQGKFLAKKGIWVSEHRIESGLNCGGHAFPTDGYLLGPILEEFKQRKKELCASLLELYNEALIKKSLKPFETPPHTRVTVQGGIGTYNEDQFLLTHYGVDGTGWATPFLLVPEVTTVDDETRLLLAKTGKDDLYLSDVSPLGVPFNTFRTSLSERQKWERVQKKNPGSPCPKGHLVSNTEFTKIPICTASSTYQKRKVRELESLGLPQEILESSIKKVVNKACLCEDLAAGALISNHIENKRSRMPAVCPGPNLAYFSKISTLADMIGHIYGRLSLLNSTYRPNLFISEFKMYFDYLKKEIGKSLPKPSEKQLRYFEEFKQNLLSGIDYYKTLIPKMVIETKKYRETMMEELHYLKSELDTLVFHSQVIFSESIEILNKNKLRMESLPI